MPFSQTNPTCLSPGSSEVKSSVKGAEISYQAMTLAAILLLLASLWVF